MDKENPLMRKSKKELIAMMEDGASIEKLSVQLNALIEENARLKEQVEEGKETEKFVGIEMLSKGQVWLPAPESTTGDPKYANTGRLLKAGKTKITTIPAYWMIDYIANESPAFTCGDVRVNNEKAKEIFPNIPFVDLDLPDSFLKVAISNSEIEKNVSKKDQSAYDYVNKFKDNILFLGRIKAVVDEKLDKTKEGTAERSHFDALSVHVTSLITPDHSNEGGWVEKKVVI